MPGGFLPRVVRTARPVRKQYCLDNATFTYSAPDKISGGITFGGYADNIVVDEAFTLDISPKLDLAATAPLLCAGITTYSPMRHWNVKAGQKVGVIGLGGLGHMALKFGRAFGTHVVQFTTSLSKKDDALRLGADEVVLSKDADAVKAHANSFDFIIDTVSAPHDITPFVNSLRLNGHLVLVGLPTEPLSTAAAGLIWSRRSIAGSLIGGLRETQEMLDFCADHNITSDIEMVPIQKVNEAFERTVKADVRYRFVIDMASLKNS